MGLLSPNWDTLGAIVEERAERLWDSEMASSEGIGVIVVINS